MNKHHQKQKHKGLGPLRKKRKNESDDEEDTMPSKKKKTSFNLSSIGKGDQPSLPGFSKQSEMKLKGYNRCFWTGISASSVELEALKLMRKTIGVLVKGENVDLCPPPINTITNSGIPTEFHRVFESIALNHPTTVQKQTWPAILNGNNIISIAPTGSGKTLAYGLPMIPHIQSRLKLFKCKIFDVPAPFALVLVPTRELSIQVASALKPLKRICSISAFAVYGGEDKEKQIDDLSEGPGHAIIVATPGRLLDLLHSKAISLSSITYFVIDEADRMLALGFREQITSISAQIYPERQTMMFSATFPGKLRELCDELISQPITIRCNTVDMINHHDDAPTDDNTGIAKESDVSHDSNHAEQSTTETSDVMITSSTPQANISSYTISNTVQQEVHICSSHKKPRLLIRYIEKIREEEKVAKVRQPGLMLIFCTKIKTLKFVADFLRRQHQQNFTILHGQLPQSQREKALTDFRCGKIPVLIATDVAARGIHVKQLKFVVNYDFPSNLEQYCHRVGRTGRQGEQGFAYSLLTRNLAPLTRDLIALLKSCQQEIEPNLLLLCDEFNSGTMSSQEFVIEDDNEV